MKGQRIPTKITLDAYAASHRAVADIKEKGELPKRVLLRSSKYLNNQDHRRIKQRLCPMLGLKSFRTAALVIGGIELAEKIQKSGHSKSANSAAARRRYQRSGKLPSLPSLRVTLKLLTPNQFPPNPEFAPQPYFGPATVRNIKPSKTFNSHVRKTGQS
jgi:hypothetical protein